MKTAFKTFFKVLLALGVVFGLVAALRYMNEQRADYIEIYNDDLDEGLFE